MRNNRKKTVKARFLRHLRNVGVSIISCTLIASSAVAADVTNTTEVAAQVIIGAEGS